MSFIDFNAKVFYPRKVYAYSIGGSPEYYQYWLEEGIDCEWRCSSGAIAPSSGTWAAALNNYVDYMLPVPVEGLTLDPGDYVVGMVYECPAADDGLCTLQASYRCDAGAHVDTGSAVALPAASVGVVYLPVTVTAYTATATAAFNVKVTAYTGAGVALDPSLCHAGPEPGQNFSSCVGVDADAASVPTDFYRTPSRLTITSHDPSTHQAPILMSGVPTFTFRGDGIYEHDYLEIDKFTDANRADTHALTQQQRLLAKFVGTTLTEVGPIDSVTTFGDSTAETMAPPDACLNNAPTATTWAPLTVYAVDDIVVPTYPNDHYYKAVYPGTSGATEPNWPTDGGYALNDGTIVSWQDMGELLEYGVNTCFRFRVSERPLYDEIIKRRAPVAYWPLGDAASVAWTCVDEMGTLDLTYQNEPSMQNTALEVNDGQKGPLFNGTDEYAKTAAPPWAAGSWPATMTLELWFKDTVPGTADTRRLFCAGAGANDYMLLIVGHSGTQYLHFLGERGGSAWGAYKTSAYTANVAHHLVCTYSSGTVAIWLDGVKLSTTAGTGSYNFTGVAIANDTSGSANRWFEGVAQKVAIYDRALAPSEIWEDYWAGLYEAKYTDYLVETLLDTLNPLNVDSGVDAPTLTAEADTTTAVSVRLEWTDPATWDNNQPLGYQVKMTVPDGSVLEKAVGTRNYYDWGQLPPGTYAWTVKSIDPWGSVSAYAAEDSFVVTLSSSAPTCTLDPIPRTVYSQPLIGWSWQDVDAGHVQTAYEVEVATDAAFTALAIDTGTVASTALSYQCAGLANGTYYVRARVYTTEWGDWDQDTFALADPTSQSALVELFRIHPESTPGNLVLSKIWTPIASVVATRKYGGAGGFEFCFSNLYPFVERSLVAAHLMDEVSGAVAHDIVGGYNLTLVGSPPWTSNVLNLVGGADYGYSVDLDFTLDSEFTAFLVLYPSCTSGVAWFLGAYANNSNWYDIYSNGAGKLRVATPADDSGDLTVVTAGWVILRVTRVGTTLSLTNYNFTPAISVTAASGAYTGTPRLAIGRYMGSTPAGTLSGGKVAAHLLYSDSLTDAEEARNVQALKEYLLHRGVSI